MSYYIKTEEERRIEREMADAKQKNKAVYDALYDKLQQVQAKNRRNANSKSGSASESSTTTQPGPLGLTSFSTILATLSNPYS